MDLGSRKVKKDKRNQRGTDAEDDAPIRKIIRRRRSRATRFIIFRDTIAYF